MSMILLAVENADRDEPIRDLLTAEGWWVTTVGSQEEALRAAADHAPQLLIVDQELARAGDLLRAFRWQEGGPGILVLVDEETTGAVAGGDGTLARNQSEDDVVETVRRSLRAPRPGGARGPGSSGSSEEEQLTASDLFGDILEDLGEAREAGAGEETAAENGVDEERAVGEDLEAEPTHEAAVGETSLDDVVADELQADEEAPEEEREEDLELPAAEKPLEPESEAQVEEELAEGPGSAVGAIEAELPAGGADHDDVAAAGEGAADLVGEVAELLEDAEIDWAQDAGSEEGEVAPPSDAALPDAEPPGAEMEPDVDDASDTIGGYRLLELIDFGDLTERWLAEREVGGGEVVVERIRHELRERAGVREAFVEGFSEVAGWEHENVLRVLDLGRDGEVDFAVTEHHPGYSLAQVLNRVHRMQARMPLGISLFLVERIAAALESLSSGAAASSHGWLVPDSVWLTDTGRVLLREFSYGRMEPSSDPPTRDWREHRFLSPESWAGERSVRGDLYSLGALLYEMISGRPVHSGDDLGALSAAIATEDAVPARTVDPTIPAEVDAWIMRLLRRSAAERPQGVTEITGKVDLAVQALPARPTAKDLEVYLRQLFAARLPELEAESGAPLAGVEMPGEEDLVDETSAPRRFWPWILVALAIGAGLAYGWWLWSHRRVPEPSAPEVELQETTQPVPLEPAGAASTVAAPVESSGLDVPAEAAPELEAPPPALAGPGGGPSAEDQGEVDVEALVADEFARRERALQERLAAEPTDEEPEEGGVEPTPTEEDEGPPGAARTHDRALH